MIVCGMSNISPWIFTELLRGGKDATDEWQVRVWHENKMDMVELRVEITESNNGHTPRTVIENVNRNLRKRFADFQKNLDMKLYEFRVIPVPRGTLRTARKLKRIVALDAPPIRESAAQDLSIVGVNGGKLRTGKFCG